MEIIYRCEYCGRKYTNPAKAAECEADCALDQECKDNVPEYVELCREIEALPSYPWKDSSHVVPEEKTHEWLGGGSTGPTNEHMAKMRAWASGEVPLPI